jgi:hypothetical protein
MLASDRNSPEGSIGLRGGLGTTQTVRLFAQTTQIAHIHATYKSIVRFKTALGCIADISFS